MRAAQIDRFGPPDVLIVRDVAEPVPGFGEILIRVEAAGVTFVDTMVRAGNGPAALADRPMPFVPGNAVGGTVAEVGSGVDGELIGRRVVSSTGGAGGYAEAVVVAADLPIPVPDQVDLRDAVAVLADGRTAMAIMRDARIKDDDRVLVTAAAGGVGSLLVQLARGASATVVAAAGGQRKLELARTLGADHVVDYRVLGWAARVGEATGGAGVSVVLDGVGGEIGRDAFDLAVPGARIVVYGFASGSVTEATLAEVFERRVTVIGGPLIASPADNRALTEAALAEVAAGRLRPIIGQTFPLERAAEAHAAIEDRATLGKTLLVV